MRAAIITTLLAQASCWLFSKGPCHIRSSALDMLRVSVSSPASTEAFTSNRTHISPYTGPLADMDSMEACMLINDLGIRLTIGPSVFAKGRGMFISLAEEKQSILLPKGTPICIFGKGIFTNDTTSDKAVGFELDKIGNGVIFENRIMPLVDAIMMARDKSNVMPTIRGHNIRHDCEINEIMIEVDKHFEKKVFEPFDSGAVEIDNFGMLANDRGYDPSVFSRQDYLDRAEELNILLLVWRLELNSSGDVLEPTWPLVVLDRDLLLTNSRPMEVGVTYCYRYWESTVFSSLAKYQE
jgi:hypothetical protein